MSISRDNKDNLSTPPQTEDTAERGFVKQPERAADPVTYQDLGKSEELEPDGDSGDIADEGSGHRG